MDRTDARTGEFTCTVPGAGNTDLVDRGAGTPLERMVRFFEALRPEDVDRLAEIYAHDAQFVDPFNDVKGTEAIGRIFAHMFVQLDEPRFIVLERLQAGEQAFLTWDFVFRFRSGASAGLQRIHGGTHLRFNHEGKVVLHRDYWDAAGELYAKLPLIGALMRWLRRRAGTPP
jgi:steroid delta-isomerase